MSRTTTVRAVEALTRVRADQVSEAVIPPLLLAGSGKKLQAEWRPNSPSCGVVSGLLAKHEDSPGVLIVAKVAGEAYSCTSFRDAAGNVIAFDLEELVCMLAATFRSHPHINNVLTHLCGRKWERVGQALHIILNPLATLNDLSPLAQNLVELMCAERGPTGRILKPYLHALLARALPLQIAAYLRVHVFRLLLEMQVRDARLSRVVGERRRRAFTRVV